MIDQLFPDAVVTVTSDNVNGELVGLLPEERSQIQRAVAKRQIEYAAGRQCARAALRRLDVHGFALVNDADRVPIWPAGIVGSVTHCHDFCGVAVTRKHPILGIGVDAESLGDVDDGVRRLVCRPAEREIIENGDAGQRDFLFKAVFSAKESFYKAMFPLFRVPLDFQDVEILMGEGGGFLTTVLAGMPSGFERLEITGRMVATGQHVFTGVTLTE